MAMPENPQGRDGALSPARSRRTWRRRLRPCLGARLPPQTLAEIETGTPGGSSAVPPRISETPFTPTNREAGVERAPAAGAAADGAADRPNRPPSESTAG
eukprot:scaffold31860_cov90-Isochrysis_galbana.AAC.2